MDMPLHILVVDDRPNTVRFLTDFLVGLGHRVELCGSAGRAAAAIQQRRAGGDPYDLMVAKLALPDLDGIELLREVRRLHDPMAVALYHPFAELDPARMRHAEPLNCAMFMDQPIELRKVEELIGEVRAHRQRGTQLSEPSPRTATAIASRGGRTPQPHGEEQPFFGASRGSQSGGHAAVSDVGSGGAPSFTPTNNRLLRPPSGSGVVPTTGLGAKPPTAAPTTYRKQNSGLFYENSGSFRTNTTTSRLRRSITGRVTNDAAAPKVPNDPPPERRVMCAHCGQQFVVSDRAETYTMVCVHCGKLNRIEPRAR